MDETSEPRMQSSAAPTVVEPTQGENEDATRTRSKRSHDDMLNTETTKTQGSTQTLDADTQNAASDREPVPPGTPSPGQRQEPDIPITPSKTPAKAQSTESMDKVDEHTVEDEVSDTTDPGEPIETFDWADLEDRFLSRMADQDQKEAQAMKEWEELMNFFRVWVAVPVRHEEDRATKRLRTRVSHVQYSESMLEDKRSQYMRIVDAFKSALSLFDNS